MKFKFFATPWRLQPEEVRYSQGGPVHIEYEIYSDASGADFYAGRASNEANGQRIVACVNACAGIADPSAIPDLLAACKLWLSHYDQFVRTKDLGDEPGIADMRKAIVKAEGGAA